MCKLFSILSVPSNKPNIALLKVPSSIVLQEVGNLNQSLMYPCLLDAGEDYYYTTLEDWGKVFYYTYIDFNMPSYIAARMDCEDFGILLKGLISSLFGLNSFAFVVGDIPQGAHGFNMLRTEDGYFLWEPQSGFGLAEPFRIGENGYYPHYALL